MNLDLLKTVYIMPPIYSKVKWIFYKVKYIHYDEIEKCFINYSLKSWLKTSDMFVTL